MTIFEIKDRIDTGIKVLIRPKHLHTLLDQKQRHLEDEEWSITVSSGVCTISKPKTQAVGSPTQSEQLADSAA